MMEVLMYQNDWFDKSSNSTRSLKLKVKFNDKFFLTVFKYYYHKYY